MTTTTTSTTTRKVPVCFYEWSGYPHPGCAEFGPPDTFSCQAEATVYVWLPPTNDGPYPDEDGTVLAACDEHAVDPLTEAGAERVALYALPLTCAGCGYPVWAAHAAEHGGPCDFCAMNGLLDLREKGQHATCSCPEEAAWAAAMETAGVAIGRAETDPCERGTVGCSVAHPAGPETDCQPW